MIVKTQREVEELNLDRSDVETGLLDLARPRESPAPAPPLAPNDEHFDQFKRLIYSITLPFIGVGVVVLVVAYDVIGLGHQVFQPLLLVLAGCFALLSLLLQLVRVRLWPFEAVTLTAVAGLLLVRFYYLFDLGPAQVESGVLVRALTLPVLYTFVFLALPGTYALGALVGFYLTLVVIGVGRALPAGEPKLAATLALFYAWNAVIIVVLHFFSRFKEDYVEVRMRVDQMAYLAFNDYLTGLPNRRGIERILQDEVERARRYGRPLSVVMVDLDHLKRVNDAFGHDVGDRALQEVAQLLSRELRRTDRIGRWGGEEFIIVAPETDRKAAWVLAQRLKETLENRRFDQVGTITASYGVASFRPDDTVQSLIKRADEALYRAKTGGRNRVEVEIG